MQPSFAKNRLEDYRCFMDLQEEVPTLAAE